jgi:hypothetical protein
LRRIHRSADHLNGRSYLLPGRQLLPGQYGLSQRDPISRSTSAVDKTEFEPRIAGLKQRVSELQVRHQAALEAAETGRVFLAPAISRRKGLRRSVITLAGFGAFGAPDLPTSQKGHSRPGRASSRSPALLESEPASCSVCWLEAQKGVGAPRSFLKKTPMTPIEGGATKRCVNFFQTSLALDRSPPRGVSENFGK